MKHKSLYLFLLPAIILLLAGCSGCNQNKMPSLLETYSKKDKNPFGASLAYRQLKAIYPNYDIQDKKLDFKETWENISDTGSLYICMAPKLFVSDEEVTAMMEYVEAGNSLFISAGKIDEFLMNETGSSEVYNSPVLDEISGKMKNTSVRGVVQPESRFGYYYHPFQNYFVNIDSSNTRVLGYNEKNKPNFMVYFHGKGKLYLQCDARAYSNYFLLKEDNFRYLVNSLAFTDSKPQHIYWDDYYYKLTGRNNEERDFSSFSEIMKHPPLKAAFWLSLLLLLLYILFGGKRVQRIIKQLKPNENTTVTFTETIGRLYLQKKDNKNIAEKMITYFNEYIRNTYFLNTNQVSEDFIMILSRKSGVEKDKVDTLYRSILATQGSDVVNDYQLLSLNDQIQNFYKNTGNKS